MVIDVLRYASRVAIKGTYWSSWIFWLVYFWKHKTPVFLLLELPVAYIYIYMYIYIYIYHIYIYIYVYMIFINIAFGRYEMMDTG